MITDTLSPFGSLVRALVARETDHEQIATACGVSRSLSHPERTAAILETLRVLADSRSAWHSEALTLRACLRELCQYAGAEVPADDAPPSTYLDRLVAISEGRRDRLASTLALLGATAPRSVDEMLRDLRAAVECFARSQDAWTRHAADCCESIGRITAQRDAWRRDASTCADALAAVAEALGIEPTYDPARGTETGARALAALASLTKRCTAAETALTDVAAALDAQPEGDPYDPDAIARGCLATIARDCETVQEHLARIEDAKLRADRYALDAGDLREQLRAATERAESAESAERRATALAFAVEWSDATLSQISHYAASAYLLAKDWTPYRAPDGAAFWTFDEPLRANATHRHRITPAHPPLAPLSAADVRRLAMVERRAAALVVAELLALTAEHTANDAPRVEAPENAIALATARRRQAAHEGER